MFSHLKKQMPTLEAKMKISIVWICSMQQLPIVKQALARLKDFATKAA